MSASRSRPNEHCAQHPDAPRRCAAGPCPRGRPVRRDVAPERGATESGKGMVTGSDLVLETERRGDVRIVRAAGRVDFASAPAFQETLFAEAVAADGRGGLIVDLGGLDLITSAGLRVLIQTKRSLTASGAALVVVGVAGTVADVFRVSRFDTLLTISGTVEEAMAGSWPGAAGRG